MIKTEIKLKDFVIKNFFDLKKNKVANVQIKDKGTFFIIDLVNDKNCQEKNNPYYVLRNIEKEKRPIIFYMDLNYYINNYKDIELC